MMRTQIGQLFFGLGLVIAIALAAKSPRWEAFREAAAALSAQVGKESAIAVEVELGTGLPGPKEDALRRELAQALAMEGVAVREDAPRRVAVQAAPGYPPEARVQLVLEPGRAEAGAMASPIELELRRPWPATLAPWALFAALSAVGVLLWRSGARAQAAALAAGPAGESQNPFALLAALVPPAQALAAAAATYDAKQLQRAVDELLEGYLLPFAEVRQRVVDRVGMRDGSEVLVTLAYGERTLNRAWSAAADGHVPEARRCIPRAVAALEEANRLAVGALARAGR